MAFRTLRFSVLLTVLLATAPCSTTSAADVGAAAELMRLVATTYAANWEQIETWQGAAEISSVSTVKAKEDKGPRLRTQRLTAKFYLDVRQEMLHSTVEAVDMRYLDSRTNTVLRTVPRQHAPRLSIWTPEHFVYADQHPRISPGDPPSTGAPFTVENRLVHRNRSEAGSRASNGFDMLDPRQFLELFGRPVHRNLELVAEGHDNGKWSIMVEEAGDGYRAHWIMGLDQSERFDVDLRWQDSQLLLRQASLDAGRRRFLLSWDYAAHDGLFVPVMWRSQTYDEHGNMDYELSVRLKVNRVNEDLPPGIFSYAALDLNDGDRLIDKVRGEELIFQDGVPVASAD